MNVSIHVATTEAEREAVYRLRYEIYVEEMHIFGAVADHTRRVLIDPNDADARLIYATVDGEIVGSLRLNLGTDAPFSREFEETYHLARFRPAITDEQILVLTRFMVNQTYRGSLVAFKMIGKAADIAMREGVEVSLCDCQPHLIRYYNRLGFRSYDCPVYNDPEFGIMAPLALIMGDLDYLQRIRSPLHGVLSQQQDNRETGRRLVERLGRAAVQTMDDAEAAEHALAGLLNEEAGGQAGLFDGLEADDVRSVISKGYVIACGPGDRVIRQGQPTCTVFVVLSGSLEVRDEGRLLAESPPGDVVGELAFLLSARRTADVYAGAQGARLLVLDEQRLRRQLKASSRVAPVLLRNLTMALAHKLAATMSQRRPQTVMMPTRYAA